MVLIKKGETEIEKQNHLLWSPTLHDAYQIWVYWKIKLSVDEPVYVAHRYYTSLKYMGTTNSVPLTDNIDSY
jgi:hypothetical protein